MTQDIIWKNNKGGESDALLVRDLALGTVSTSSQVKSRSPFPRPMAYRAAPISVSIALGHAFANAVKAIAGGGWSTGSSASLTFSLHSHMSSARREGSEYHF